MPQRSFTRPRWALRGLAALDRAASSPKAHKRIRKLFRMALPRAYKHHAICGPRFNLLGDELSQEREIVWDGRVVGSTQSLTEVRDRHAGETCFVVGTGPSINALDLTRLQGHAVMGVNGAIAVLDKHGVTPRHYTVTDLDFFENRHDLIEQVILSGADSFFSPAGLRAIAERSPDALTRTPIYLTQVVNRRFGSPCLAMPDFQSWAIAQDALVMPDPLRADDSRVGWSWDMRLGVFCSRTILFRALQIAAFLGYRTIHVLGMDLNYKGPHARAYDEGANMRPTKIERDFEPFILPAFQVLAKLIQAGEIEVFNLSSESRMPIEVIPRMSYDNALSASAPGTQTREAKKK